MLNDNSRSFLNFVIFDIKSCFYELFEWLVRQAHHSRGKFSTKGKNTFCVKTPFVLSVSKDEFERIQTGLDLS